MLTMTRVFNAPRELLFEVYTQAHHLEKFFAPKGFTTEVRSCDVRPGGRTHYRMYSGQGQEMWGKFDYTVVERPLRLEYINSFSDEEGGTTVHPLSPTWPREVYNIWLFEEVAGEPGKTRLEMTSRPHNATEEETATFVAAMSGVEAASEPVFAQLAEYLATLSPVA